MSLNFTFDVRGLPETKAMLAQYQGRQLQNRLRRATYAGAKAFRAPMQSAEASLFGTSGDEHVPYSFRTVDAPRRSTSGYQVSARIRPRSPLFNILEPGAKAHMIVPGQKGFNSYRPSRPYPTAARPSGKRFLGGPAAKNPGVWDAKGRKRKAAFSANHPVRHPGLRGRETMEPVFRGHVRAAADAVALALFDTTSVAAQLAEAV